MTKIISLTGQMIVRQDKEKEFRVIVKELLNKIRKQKGCLSYRFAVPMN